MRCRLGAIAVTLVLVGCTPQPATTPAAGPSAPAPLTPAVLGALIEEHFGTAYAVSGTPSGRLAVEPTEWLDGMTATAYYRATPGVAERRVTLTFSPMPNASVTCPPATCEQRAGAYVRTPPGAAPDVLLPGKTGLVQVQVEGPGWSDVLRDAATALAADARIAPLTDAALAATATANPRWRADPDGCPQAAAPATVPVPIASGGDEAPTPQALAALIAGHIATGCVGGRTRDGIVEATAYLGADTEWVSLSVTGRQPGCDGLDACEDRDGVTVGWQLDVPEGHTAMVRLVRRSAEGPGWVVVEHHSLSVDVRTRRFPVPLDRLLELVRDERVGPRVDAALNRAGDALPLWWRLDRGTAD